MLSQIPGKEITGFQSAKSIESALTPRDYLVTDSVFRTSSQLNPNVILQKDIYDKIAAGIVLSKFVGFYNDPEATRIKDDYLELRSI